MTFVFFIYGLSFFVLGLSVLIYPKRGSAFKLATHLYLVAAFGLIHGINEWVDMFITIGESAPGLLGGDEWIFFLKASRMVFLPGSFLCLVWFGVRVIAESKAGFSAMKHLPVILPALWVVLFIASRERLVMGDISARYLLCFPGALLTAYGLILCLAQFEKAGLSVVVRYLKLAAAVFFVYGVLAGLIVKKAGFFPASGSRISRKHSEHSAISS